MTTKSAINWYRDLSLEEKFGLKEVCVLLCGIKWEEFTLLFSPRERINILYDKLKLEGFDV